MAAGVSDRTNGAGRGPFVFFAGSGISFPSGLPLFGELLDHLRSFFPPSAAERLLFMSPEGALSAVSEAGVDVPSRLMDAFNAIGAVPNAAHYTIAARLLAGSIVWTTNYDTLIEDAAIDLDPVKANDAILNRMRKPHGTFVRGEDGSWESTDDMLYGAAQVVEPWPESVATTLVTEAQNAELVLVGYSGVDVNSYPALTDAIDVSSNVTWFERSTADVQRIRSRYRALDDASFVLAHNPSAEFVARFPTTLPDSVDASCPVEGRPSMWKAANWTRPLTEAMLHPSVQLSIATAAGERALITQLVADIRKTRHQHRRTFRKERLKDLRIRELRRIGWWAALNLPPQTPLPNTIRARAVNALTIPPGRHDSYLARLDYWATYARDGRAKAWILNARSRSLRAFGRYPEALAASTTALELSRRHRLATEAAQSQFEGVEALRTMGRLNAADDLVRLRLETLGMVHWYAWMEYQRACIAVQRGDPASAQASFRRTLDFFSSSAQDNSTQYSASNGAFFAGLVGAAIARLEGDGEGALNELEVIPEEYYEASPLLRSARQFQVGEANRLLRDWGSAANAYATMDPRFEMFGALAAIGTAFAYHGAGGASDEIQRLCDEAAQGFLRHDSSVGASYVVSLASETAGLEPKLLRSAQSLVDRESTPVPTVSPDLQIRFV